MAERQPLRKDYRQEIRIRPRTQQVIHRGPREEVWMSNQPRDKPRVLKCWRCGQGGHTSRHCVGCWECDQSGHIAQECPLIYHRSEGKPILKDWEPMEVNATRLRSYA